jgi:hypothetical protein
MRQGILFVNHKPTILMNHSQDVYDVRELAIPETEAIHYYFISEGKESIVKLIRYEYVRQFSNRPLFNLGFGDLDYETGELSDEKISDNEDHYRVFNTVLATIPRLLNEYRDGVVMVRGSDSTPQFIEGCKKVCVKKCGDHLCKKAHRRIRIYGNFLNKHYELLNQEFAFHGAEGMEEDSPTEPYKKDKSYKGLIIEKRLN